MQVVKWHDANLSFSAWSGLLALLYIALGEAAVVKQPVYNHNVVLEHTCSILPKLHWMGQRGLESIGGG